MCDDMKDIIPNAPAPPCYKHGVAVTKSCVEQCMHRKDDPNAIWKNMVKVYGSSQPDWKLPPKQHCDLVYSNMKPTNQ